LKDCDEIYSLLKSHVLKKIKENKENKEN